MSERNQWTTSTPCFVSITPAFNLVSSQLDKRKHSIVCSRDTVMRPRDAPPVPLKNEPRFLLNEKENPREKLIVL